MDNVSGVRIECLEHRLKAVASHRFYSTTAVRNPTYLIFICTVNITFDQDGVRNILTDWLSLKVA